MTLAVLALAGLAVACLFMGCAWLGARKVDNIGWVDAAWAFSFLALLLVCLALGTAPAFRMALAAVLVGVWSLRLGTYLARRVASHAEEEPRYKSLRISLGRRPWPQLFWFFQAQALVSTVLSIPFFSAALNTNPALSATEVLAAVLCLCGLSGEALADFQLARFRANPANRGRVCDRGLWGWSRHPNYFFEWVVWIGFGLLGVAGPAGAVALVSPAVMLVLLTMVTGIPPAEAQSLASRGDAYRDYQRRTSPFLPLPPRRHNPPSR